jgi:Lrp/AsnC family leucine-responsive transcriptional regulator
LSFPKSPLLADGINVRLLEALADTPRMTTSELARRVGMSAPAVRERVQRLEDAGVLRGCRIELDPAALGYPVAVIVRIKPMPGELPAIIELARRTPRVVECLRITGDDCFLVRAHLESIDALDSLLDPFLAHGQTTTSIVQSAPVPLRTLPLG